MKRRQVNAPLERNYCSKLFYEISDIVEQNRTGLILFFRIDRRYLVNQGTRDANQGAVRFSGISAFE